MTKSCSITNNMEQIVLILKSISDENRLKIICLLKDWPQCVCDIVDFLHLPQNLISHHLKRLKDIWVISSEKNWLKVTYTLNSKALDIIKDFLHTLH